MKSWYLGEVKTCEFAPSIESCFVVGFGGLDCGFEGSERFGFIIIYGEHSRKSSIPSFVSSSITRTGNFPRLAIGLILRLGAETKIGFLVIKSVSISVIYTNPVGSIDNETV